MFHHIAGDLIATPKPICAVDKEESEATIIEVREGAQRPCNVLTVEIYRRTRKIKNDVVDDLGQAALCLKPERALFFENSKLTNQVAGQGRVLWLVSGSCINAVRVSRQHKVHSQPACRVVYN